MLRRRPAAVYELLAEDELLERDQAARRADDGDLREGHEPVTAAIASSVASPPATARRTLLVALTAAALAGFAVWELLGIATNSAASRPAMAFEGLRPDYGQPRQPGRRGSRPPWRAQGPRRAARSVPANRAATGTSTRNAVSVALASAVSPLPTGPGSPTTHSVAVSPAPTSSTPVAEQEFGFER